ncbi:MAG: hypothetical protein FJY75_01800 [Candidatus Eisenbacteria bacterium]|uniref:DUF3570 domain-containing protein n=1 Tax=Eiseniibacteriota bacterium TaxID=2212470 RepID=A0A937X8R1_UNCEI|nr:hypothetical protein [Candidatus Eisenbacteria bacterium]
MRGAGLRSWGMWSAVLACAAILPAGVSAQKPIIDVYADPISLFDPGIFSRDGLSDSLATALPRYMQRPMDNLLPRPGGEALGMGGAYTARAEGAVALGWNPAGMARLEQASIFVDGYLRSSSGSGSHLPDTIEVAGLGEFNIQSYGADLYSRKAFGFIGASRPLVRLGPAPLVGGIAYRQHTGVAFGQATLLTMGLYQVGGSGFPFVLGVDNEEKGSIESLTLGLAYEPVRAEAFSFAAGASANFLTGRLRSTAVARAAVRNFEEGSFTFQRNYKGFSVETGFLLTMLQEKLRLGGWVGLPHKLACDNSRLSYSPLILPDAPSVERVHWDVAGYDMEIPLFFSAGVAVGPIRGVELSADLNERPWSEVEIRHHEAAFARFDGPFPAPDVSSVHVGVRFPFPLLRQAFESRGLRLLTQLGYHTMPLAMYSVDPVEGEPPYYWSGEQVEGSAASFGFTLETRARIDFHFGVEVRSYEFDSWFLGDQRGPRQRQLGFRDPAKVVTEIDRTDTILRLSSEMRL